MGNPEQTCKVKSVRVVDLLERGFALQFFSFDPVDMRKDQIDIRLGKVVERGTLRTDVSEEGVVFLNEGFL